MEVQCWSSAPKSIPNSIPRIHHHHNHFSLSSYKYYNRKLKNINIININKSIITTTQLTCILKLGVDDIASIAHNKVLIAAGVSAAIGQLSKPFTSQFLYGKPFNFMSTFQAGGFPSTHSSAVIATATSLALERGFSDSIFGLCAVYAGLVMYDAQGVRREVGIHAKTLNKVLTEGENNSLVSKDRDNVINSSPQGTASNLNELNVPPLLSKEGRPFVQNSTNAPLLLESDTKTKQTNQVQVSSNLAATEKGSEDMSNSSSLLKESIGHTEVEVIAGALLGFFVGITIYAIM